MAESGWSTALAWRKSTFSAERECVEVAVSGQFVFVGILRRSNPPIAFPLSSWSTFLNKVKARELDPGND